MLITFSPQSSTATFDCSSHSLALCAGNISIYSDERFEKTTLADGRTLMLWGTVYDVSEHAAEASPASQFSRFAELVGSSSLAEALQQTEGQFLGVLLSQNDEATIFADAFHRRELFYANVGAALVASTQLSALVTHLPGIGHSIASLACCMAVYGNYAPKRHTLYDGIRKLGVGERIRLSRTGHVLEQDKFTPSEAKEYQHNELAEYAKIMRKAVSVRGSQHHNWLFMSSGFDSSALLALLVERYGSDRVTGVIGRLRYSQRSGTINQFELDRAQLIAEHYGIALDVVDLDYTTPDSISHVKKVAKAMRGHHLYLNSAYNFYLLSEHIASKAGPDDAVFAGEVSDAVHNLGFSQFASILEHPDLGFREYSDKMASYLFGPSFLKRALKGDHESDLVFQIFKQRNGQERFLSTAGMDEMSIKSTFLASFFLRKRRVPFFGHANNPALTPEGNAWFDQTMRAEYLDEYAASLTPENLYSIMLHLYHSFHWQGATPMNMAASVRDLLHREVAMPFWDRRLHAFLSQAPENWGRGLEIRPTKYPLKWMLEHELHYPMHLQTGPHSYLYDVNPQFSHTSEFLFGSALAPYFKETLASRPYRRILSPEWFNLEYLDGLVQRYVAGEEFGGDEASALLDLVNLCVVGWFE